ncbi:CobW family GTP-binding protein [Cupriavidus taiwanensis]|uniref:Cobalamin biosynthesis protein CobW n=1 Tax=Cupriavidus taiwanensis TaxID=164546 RepID=A0A375IP61_9BURK|nr:CobW family GTP-binding protein [Cupriavidus taiwanensis]SOY72750.1 Cobalamin biosynthesis protein CobW [Cupriavidus taiwanensis]SOY72977.1 Cobalamin biosynthesis protein CobW [Cupriavidus taiwanensis]SOY96955.1 Cobalamin biosynthesis protein CobW [Cupriavidus taiwanensis]SOZ30863.1 Cobalamin biosynthesis protein CobW [Cupriavidus taiwanensis]SOZ66852.1 Cobalamin biosynthesis protein CobW [Cupriavidus taiwanensis]
MNARAPIPLVVVGGYLGAGKTTLLNRLLADAQGCRIAVLVNDFGAVNIDAALVRARSDDVIELENGCICCSIGGRLAEALVAIAARAQRPELLVIEASGVSEPQRIAQVGLLDPAFRLNAVLVAVDVTSVHDSLRDPLVGDMVRRQIAGASVVALTKADLAGAAAVARAAATAAGLAPHATVLTARRGELPLPVFLDAGALPAPGSAARLDGSGWQRGAAAGGHAGIRSFAYQTHRGFDKARLRHALASAPVRLLRAKGLVRFDGDPRLHEVHLVAGRMRLRPAQGAGLRDPALVFIGAFDAAAEARLRACIEAALA